MKQVIQLFLLSAILYTLLSFSALSINPLKWNHIERFIFAVVVLFGILVSVGNLFLPKPILKVE